MRSIRNLTKSKEEVQKMTSQLPHKLSMNFEKHEKLHPPHERLQPPPTDDTIPSPTE